jgi:hypothetical protein
MFTLDQVLGVALVLFVHDLIVNLPLFQAMVSPLQFEPFKKPPLKMEPYDDMVLPGSILMLYVLVLGGISWYAYWSMRVEFTVPVAVQMILEFVCITPLTSKL